MSVSNQAGAKWLRAQFRETLDRIESLDPRFQSQHDRSRPRIERLNPRELDEVRLAWRHYCEVIAELGRTAAELDSRNS
jgi:hypothetical protein